MLKPNANGFITKSTVQSVSLPRDVHEKIGRIVYELIELDEELKDKIYHSIHSSHV